MWVVKPYPVSKRIQQSNYLSKAQSKLSSIRKTATLNMKYRSVPLIRPPILYTTSSLKWGGGGGLIFEYAISLEYKPPPPQKFYATATYTSNNYGDIFQDREYCPWTSRLQSFVVSLHRRRAASSMRGQ